ncbi:hypothetical protein [Aestuariibacter salexigens]|uniref:hypothetical protein n=1 Tax=Aestuariibacter salexigens TaxID=226010 RepID=UPI00041A4405|nr:hypothetical protein [Aestuariibacter salexigens]
MRVFFWASVLTYLFLYFWAAYLYEGFDMGLAILIAVVFFAALGVWLKRRKAQPQEVAQPVGRDADDTKPLSIWQSPLPYMVIAIAVFITVFFTAL